MKFVFDAKQEFQVKAIDSVVSLFEGQVGIGSDMTFDAGTGIAAVANRFDVDEAEILSNVQNIQAENGIEIDDKLEYITERILTSKGEEDSHFMNFSVEMETGTGKTYVYLRTVFELHEHFGLRKFIVVVPSVAIREGVLKTLEITEEHFAHIYGNPPFSYYVYDSKSLSRLRPFALSDGIEILVMTIDSFNKESNVIWKSQDRLQGMVPMDLIQAVNPVVILDEPQNMESELRVKAVAALDPVFVLRYSATHRNPYNLVYRLSPYDAYRQGLVKRIEVASIVEEGDIANAYVRLDEIKARRTIVTAQLTIHGLQSNCTVKEKKITVRPGDTLEDKAGRLEYRGFEVDEISKGGGYIRFKNNIELSVGESRGDDRDAIFDAQIRYTIEEHLSKQAKLKGSGIKVLSLFFIDRVSNYVDDDGIIRRLFTQAFEEIKNKYPDAKDKDVQAVQTAYFAKKKIEDGSIGFVDSTPKGQSEAETAAYDLIMKNKEQLLSFEEPSAFVFSHSALREGWDNPNIFQICTLNQTVSDMKKRQEVGRGVRLCVDQNGNRVHDEQINVLTVVANESYEEYVSRLQSEMEEDYGGYDSGPRPPDARRRSVAKLKKKYVLKPEFKEIWGKISQKTRYAVGVNTERLLTDVLSDVNKLDIQPPRIVATKYELRTGTEDSFEAYQMTPEKHMSYIDGRLSIPNTVELISDLLERTSPPVRLTRNTLLEIIKRTNKKDAAIKNPEEFAAAIVRILKEKLAEHIVSGIRYEKIDDWYEMTNLQPKIEGWLDSMVESKSGLYEYVIFDSDIEKDFVSGLERRADVRLYFKLPSWFTVPTPVGEYNPDWAIVMEQVDEHGEPTGKPKLYLVRETKDPSWPRNARSEEVIKVSCGQAHFESTLGVSYKVVSDAADLP